MRTRAEHVKCLPVCLERVNTHSTRMKSSHQSGKMPSCVLFPRKSAEADNNDRQLTQSSQAAEGDMRTVSVCASVSCVCECLCPCPVSRSRSLPLPLPLSVPVSVSCACCILCVLCWVCLYMVAINHQVPAAHPQGKEFRGGASARECAFEDLKSDCELKRQRRDGAQSAARAGFAFFSLYARALRTHHACIVIVVVVVVVVSTWVLWWRTVLTDKGAAGRSPTFPRCSISSTRRRSNGVSKPTACP